MSALSADLPYVDEHSVAVGAGPEATWDAVLAVVEGTFAQSSAGRGARLLGCADVTRSGPRPLTTGSSFPGFHVESAQPSQELVLRGSHRFSDYALTFRLDEEGDGGTLLRAETRAAFPGFKGGAYRALVIGTRGHVLVTRRVLKTIKRRAERA
jgi:hypothetical protein